MTRTSSSRHRPVVHHGHRRERTTPRQHRGVRVASPVGPRQPLPRLRERRARLERLPAALLGHPAPHLAPADWPVTGRRHRRRRPRGTRRAGRPGHRPRERRPPPGHGRRPHHHRGRRDLHPCRRRVRRVDRLLGRHVGHARLPRRDGRLRRTVARRPHHRGARPDPRLVLVAARYGHRRDRRVAVQGGHHARLRQHARRPWDVQVRRRPHRPPRGHREPAATRCGCSCYR